jgi:DNA-binding NarL/FixJ family response regulator
MKKVLIVEKQNIYAEFIKNELKNNQSVDDIHLASKSSIAYSIIHQIKFDCIIIDLNLNYFAPCEFIEMALKKNPGIGIIIIWTNIKKNIISKCMELGVKGFISRNTAEREDISDAFEAVSKDKNYFCKSTFQIMTELIRNKDSISNQKPISNREKEVLELISHGYKSDEIGNQLNISKYTVETHKKNLRKKLNAKNTFELISLAHEEGLIEVN